MASEFKFVCNYVGDLNLSHLHSPGHFFLAYDSAAYMKVVGELLSLPIQTLQTISETHIKSPKLFNPTKDIVATELYRLAAEISDL